MVRVARQVWATFDFNLERARSLALSQHYLELVVERGEDAVKEYINTVIRQTMGWLGFNLDDIVSRVAAAVQAPLQAELAGYTKAHEAEMKRRVEELSKMEKTGGIPDDLRKILEPFLAFRFLSEQTLSESAVVVAVAAYEAYLKDVLSAEVRRRPSVLNAFPKVTASIDLRVIGRYGGKLRLAQGEELARSLDAFHTNSVRSYFGRVYGVGNVYGTARLEREINQVIQRRHLIVHRGGIVDHEFKRNTGSRQSLGGRVYLPHTTVLRYIEHVREFGERVRRAEGPA